MSPYCSNCGNPRDQLTGACGGLSCAPPKKRKRKADKAKPPPKAGCEACGASPDAVKHCTTCRGQGERLPRETKVEARTVTVKDAWGHSHVVGGFGDVGSKKKRGPKPEVAYVTIQPHPTPMRDAEDMFPIGLKVLDPARRQVEVFGYGMLGDKDAYVETKLGGSYAATQHLPPSAIEYLDTQVHHTRYRFTLPNGKKVEGKVQGNGGYLREELSGLKRLKKEQERAEAGKPLSIYEPKKGCVKVMPYWTAAEDGPTVAVPLKGVRIGVAP